jgi:hypothetical protein
LLLSGGARPREQGGENKKKCAVSQFHGVIPRSDTVRRGPIGSLPPVTLH